MRKVLYLGNRQASDCNRLKNIFIGIWLFFVKKNIGGIFANNNGHNASYRPIWKCRMLFKVYYNYKRIVYFK